ncbi:MAG: Efflux transporter, family, subunit [Candidatus Nomurabacteria bacterium]|nr:Efflux transporter, family, subunit [Candidatus Nomurabacteria bacterium]
MNPTFFQKIKTYIGAHKKMSIVAGLVIVVGGYFLIHSLTAGKVKTAYVLGTAEQGTVVSTVTSTGQISTSATLELKPQVSGEITAIHAKAGDKVVKGQALFSIQATDAARSVKTAQNNLAAAKLDLLATQTSLKNTSVDQTDAVKNAYTTLLSSGLTAQPADATTTGLQVPTISGNYTLGKEGDITIKTYTSQGGVSFEASGLASGIGLTNSVTPQQIGNTGLYIVFPSSIKGGLTWTISIPNKSSSSYISNKNAYDTAVKNQTQAADPASSNAVTLQSKELSVVQAQNSLSSALETLAQYTVRAPFDGVLATVPVIVGDQASSGTALGTVITNQEIVSLSLNEVDVSKVKVGDKATLAFDAIPDLSITGTVAIINPIGTVTSGVVNYTVTIALDTQDAAIKSGMSVTAAIQTAVAQNVITIPSSAVKTTNGVSYVMTVPEGDESTLAETQGVYLATAPVRTEVQVGITDGTTTEIVSGLTEGQSIVTKTVTATTTAKTTASPSLLGGGGTGGATRALR